MILEEIHMERLKTLPRDYHCSCKYCKKFFKGVLKRSDGSYYNKHERRDYYSKKELASTKEKAGHPAKTPLHIARWAIQKFTDEGDWVLDPTVGSGTTMVEAILQGRNSIGIELEFTEVTEANVEAAQSLYGKKSPKGTIIEGDARKIKKLVRRKGIELIVNNPPYWGDQSQKAMKGGLYDYNREKPNIAFEKGESYFDTLGKIYSECYDLCKKGSHLVIGVKDQIRNKKSDLLHKSLIEVILRDTEFKLKGIILLPHYPRTLFMNTYNLRFPEVKIPYYQTIVVFRREK